MNLTQSSSFKTKFPGENTKMLTIIELCYILLLGKTKNVHNNLYTNVRNN